ncbi:RHS repeat-associated core domain-containing protein [Burkholderia contaminans]|uniref:RHS repeat-associated core domain-containing protein n=1 Tax=Burkholderia contaminans TaxID=488447 RepID=UPI001581BFFA
MNYNRHRYYDPGSWWFVSKDPIELEGGLNVFQYAPNPVAWIDPTGLAKCRCPSLAECEKILSDAGISVGSHRDMQKVSGGLNDSHISIRMLRLAH